MITRRPASGFTLIELLVVIAIIGVLSAIVLASLNMARSKGNDAAVRQNLNNARTQAELFYDSNNNRYVGAVGTSNDVCAPGAMADGVKGIYSFVEAAGRANGLTVNTAINVLGSDTSITCHSTPSSGAYNPLGVWAVEAPLKGTYPGIIKPAYCVQSSGLATITDISAGSKFASGDARCDI